MPDAGRSTADPGGGRLVIDLAKRIVAKATELTDLTPFHVFITHR